MNLITWLAIILVAVAAGFALTFLYRMIVAERRADRAEESEQRTRRELEPLRQYQGVHDVNLAIATLKQHARAEQERLRQALEAERAISENWLAAQQAEGLRVIEAATTERQRVLDEAQAEARAIAGEAWAVRDSLADLRRAEQAIRNSIEGYGDRYLLPSHSVLEDLAMEYDHKEAGQELKRVNRAARDMVAEGQAAACDYAEASRARYATRFVLDAFNGKVDSILTRVKHDNVGTLQQEIRDAFDLVNHHGRAFRNARVTPEYLELRLQELRWAAVARELQLKDREEQKAIREAMREEERVRRELEKARREAEREERAIEAAMRLAEQKLAQATDAQRAVHEQELAELRARLAEAESREQRAISMAQQTKQGHVYVISNIGSFGEEVFKIGLTRRLDPLDRIRELGDASVPFSFDVHAMIFSEDAPALEAALHRELHHSRVNRVNFRKEFFSASIATLRELTETMNLDVHWTMRAEAAEYRESQALAARGELATASLPTPELDLAVALDDEQARAQ